MGSRLPEIGREEFQRRLAACSPRELPAETVGKLYLHYRELLRWNPRVSLVGPGTGADLVERHYGESLAALPWVEPGDRELVDIGSGAGFPGMVLAAALPDLRVTLVEARQRKWAFLMAATRRAGLSCRCVNARVGAALPHELPRRLDLITVRAVQLEAKEIEALSAALSVGGRLWIWAGRDEPGPFAGLARGRERRLAGSELRRLVEYRRAAQSRS